MGYSDTSVVWRAAFFFKVLGFILVLAGISSTYVADAEVLPNLYRHIGFWDLCDESQTFSCLDMVTYLKTINEDPEWVYGCRGLAVIGCILEFCTIIITLWLSYMASSFLVGNIISAICDLFSVIVSLIGACVFVTNGIDILETTLMMDADPSWSFYCIIVGQILYIIAAGLQFMEAYKVA